MIFLGLTKDWIFYSKFIIKINILKKYIEYYLKNKLYSLKNINNSYLIILNEVIQNIWKIPYRTKIWFLYTSNKVFSHSSSSFLVLSNLTLE